MNIAAKIIHPFDHAVSLKGDADRLVGEVSSDYQNMVGPFGGITAATLLQAALNHPDCEGAPVSLTVNYLGPIKAGGFDVIARLMRANRSNQHWLIELWQDEEIQCTATCVFANRRDTWYSEEVSCPDVPEMEALSSLPELPGMPPWVKQYDMRFIGGMPFGKTEEGSNSAPSESLLWMSDRLERKLDFASLTALSDAFFPRLFVRRKKLAPIGTVSMTVHFHVTEQELAELESAAVLAKASASKFASSYFDQTAEIWSADRKLLVTTSQMVYYKD